MKFKNLLTASIIFCSSFFLIGNAFSYDVRFCTESNCSSITVIFGGQTHSVKLNCTNWIGWTGVSAGSYKWSATGCGLTWSGTMTVDNNENMVLCESGSVTACCDLGCYDKLDLGTGYACKDCAGGCKMQTYLADSDGNADLLREFRDGALRNSLTGRGLISLYYDHVGELNAIFDASPKLRAEFVALISDSVGSINDCLAGDAPRIDKVTMNRTQKLLSDIGAAANGPLAEAIATIKAGLADGSLIETICK